MLDYAILVDREVSRISRSDFDRDNLLRLGIEYGLQVIGEAAYHVGVDMRASAPTLEWKKIVGMRHLLVHEYYRIKTDFVWVVATESVPKMIGILEPLVRTMGDLTGEELS